MENPALSFHQNNTRHIGDHAESLLLPDHGLHLPDPHYKVTEQYTLSSF